MIGGAAWTSSIAFGSGDTASVKSLELEKAKGEEAIVKKKKKEEEEGTEKEEKKEEKEGEVCTALLAWVTISSLHFTTVTEARLHAKWRD